MNLLIEHLKVSDIHLLEEGIVLQTKDQREVYIDSDKPTTLKCTLTIEVRSSGDFSEYVDQDKNCYPGQLVADILRGIIKIKGTAK